MNIEEFHAEIDNGERFEFGKNWKAYLKKLNKEKIEHAENSLKIMLEVKNLVGKTFIDVGSGSGLFSLAAKNLGASVVSFDFDKSSVWCTKELRNRFYKTSDDWKIIHGSIWVILLQLLPLSIHYLQVKYLVIGFQLVLLIQK